MDSPYRALCRILPWYVPYAAKLFEAIDYKTPTPCIFCAANSHWRTYYWSANVNLNPVCAQCQQKLQALTKIYTTEDPVRAIGRSLLIAVNLEAHPSQLCTNIYPLDPTACWWCRRHHSDHTMCKAELLWFIVNTSYTPHRVYFTRYLPLVHDVQKFIACLVVRASRDVYTPSTLGNLAPPAEIYVPNLVLMCSDDYKQYHAKCQK